MPTSLFNVPLPPCVLSEWLLPKPQGLLLSAGPADAPKTVVLVLGAGLLIGGLAGLWLLSRHAPRPAVLVAAVVLYSLILGAESLPIREIRFLCGILRLLVLAGVILGMIDLFRPRDRMIRNADIVDGEVVDER